MSIICKRCGRSFHGSLDDSQAIRDYNSHICLVKETTMDEFLRSKVRHARNLADYCLEQISNLQVFAKGCAASDCSEDEKQYWDMIEIKSDNIKESITSLIDQIKKGEI